MATGDRGEIFVVTPDGKGQLFYQSEERHARTLAFDRKRQSAGGHRTERADPARRNTAQDGRCRSHSGTFLRDLRDEQGRSHFPAHGLKGEFVRGVGGGKRTGAGRAANVAERASSFHRADRRWAASDRAAGPIFDNAAGHLSFPGGNRRRGSGEDRAGRFAGNGLELARRAGLLAVPDAEREDSGGHRR